MHKFSISHRFQPTAYIFHVETPPYSMPPTLCTWSRFLQACHLHNLRGIAAGDTCNFFSLDTRCIFCYFCSQCPIPQLYKYMKGGFQVNIQNLLLQECLTFLVSLSSKRSYIHKIDVLRKLLTKLSQKLWMAKKTSNWVSLRRNNLQQYWNFFFKNWKAASLNEYTPKFERQLYIYIYIYVKQR